MKKLLSFPKTMLLSVSTMLIISVAVTACSGSGSVVSNSEVSPIITSTPITIDNAGIIPVFGDSSTSTVVYVHNNSNLTISEITYNVLEQNATKETNLSSKLLTPLNVNKALHGVIDGNQCSEIAAGQSCPLTITTPILSGTNVQGSFQITATYSQNNEPKTFSQLINYVKVQNNLQPAGAKFQSGVSISGYGNQNGYATIYLYGSGQDQTYDVSSITVSNPSVTITNGNISGHQIQSNFVQAVEISSPISNSSISATITVNSDIATRLKNKLAKNKAKELLDLAQFSNSVDITVMPNDQGAILTTGLVPLINTATTTSGSMSIQNEGSKTATIGNITAESGVSNLSGCSNTSLAPNEVCRISFNVTESGGSAEITVPYTGGSISSVTANVVWYNGAGTALVAMSSSVDPLSFAATVGGSTTITVTNIGGYALSNINIPAPVVISGSATASLGTNDCATIDSLPIGTSCEYIINMNDNQTDLGAQINAGFNASYETTSGTKPYTQTLPITYNSTSYGAIITITPANPSLTISGNNFESTTQILTISNGGNLPANITSVLSNNPSYLTESATTCGASLAAGSSCTSTIQFGPTYSAGGVNGTSSYTINYTAVGQTPPGSVTSNIAWAVQGYAQSISLTAVESFGASSGNGLSGTPYLFEGNNSDSKLINLTYTNTGTKRLKITGIQNNNSAYAWTMPGDGNSCKNDAVLESGDSCSIQFENVLFTNILAIGASVGTSYTENITVPTLIYQDDINPNIQFNAQPNLPTGGTTIYAQSNQATLANTITINEAGTANESVTISHLLANATGYTNNILVSTKMESYLISGVYSGDCSSTSSNGIITQSCNLNASQVSGSGTYLVNQTLLNPSTDLTLNALFSTNASTQGLVISMNPTFAMSNLGSIALIYFASNGVAGYDGNFLAQAQARAALPNQPAFTGTTGVAAADYLCNTDESKPVLPSNTSYKAIIGAENERQACSQDYIDTPCTTTVSNNIDWVMRPFTNYINTRNNIISTTNGAGIFTFNTNNFIAFPQSGLVEGRVWTGFATGAWYISYGVTCNNWTSNSDIGAFGIIGIDDLGGFQIAADTMSCSVKQDSNTSTNGLYCVQQL
mgnify:FL=1